MAKPASTIGYNPYEHREVERPISNIGAFISLLKCVIGTGILAMPLAYMYSGIIGGTVLTILSTILLTYGMHLLIQCMVETCRQTEQGYATYPQAMAYAFSQGPGWCRYMAKASGYLVDGVLGFSHYGISVVYIVFVAQNYKQIIDYHFNDPVVLHIFIIATGLLVLPLFLIRHLKYLVPLNMVANILMYSGFFAIFYYLFRGLPALTDRFMFGDPFQLPLFFGIVLFAVTSVGVMLAIESNMAHPEKYLGLFGILNGAIIFIIITNVAFGLIGFWRYGEEVGGSITLNLPSDEIVSQYSKFAIASSVFLTYPLTGFITIDILMNHYILNGRELKHPHIVEYIIRIVFVVLGTINAMAFPNLGPLLALVGAFAISILNLIFPACMELCLLYKVSYGKIKWKLWKDLIIIIIGTIILIYGSYSAIEDMIKQYGGVKDDTETTESSDTTSQTSTTTAKTIIP